MIKSWHRKNGIWCDRLATISVFVATFAAGGLFIHAAHAQQTPLGQFVPPTGAGGGGGFQTVLTRPLPGYESSGVRFDNVVVRPSLDETFGYDSNPLGTSHPRGSAVVTTGAALNALLDQSDNQIQSALSVNDTRYLSQSVLSTTSWSAALGGSHSFGHDTANVAYSHQATQLTPNSIGVPLLIAPIPYQIDDLQMSYRFVLAHGFVVPTLELSQYTFGNGKLVGGTPFSQTYNDRFVVTPTLTVGYDLAPQRSIVFVLRDSQGLYSRSSVGIARENYNDVALLGGLNYDATAVISFRILAGYEVRTFQSTQYQSSNSPIIEASFIWLPSLRTQLDGTLSRSIQASATGAVGSSTLTALHLDLVHEVRPNVKVNATAGVDLNTYTSSGSQILYSAGFGGTYIVNRNVSVSLNYRFAARQTSGGLTSVGINGQVFGGNYTDQNILLQLHIGL